MSHTQEKKIQSFYYTLCLNRIPAERVWQTREHRNALLGPSTRLHVDNNNVWVEDNQERLDVSSGQRRIMTYKHNMHETRNQVSKRKAATQDWKL